MFTGGTPGLWSGSGDGRTCGVGVGSMGSALNSCSYKGKMEPTREIPLVYVRQETGVFGAVDSALGPDYILDFFFFK